MKVESRGKFPGVKLHLEPEEVEILLNMTNDYSVSTGPTIELAKKMAKKILKLQEEEPTLLQERTPEQIMAILVKEVEKSTLQLQAVLAGSDPAKIDKSALKEALLKYVKD